jgi:putative Mg2+ transporter-C (MgtC) family protein
MTTEAFTQELLCGLDDLPHLERTAVRLTLALVLGGLLGFEREKDGKFAGLRTHMLVALGAALFILIPLEAGVHLDQLARVVQGLTVGIGFLGGGVILKLTEERTIRGLTTAANLWVTAAVGMAVGLGWFWPAAITVVLAWLVLSFIGRLEAWIERRRNAHP